MTPLYLAFTRRIRGTVFLTYVTACNLDEFERVILPRTNLKRDERYDVCRSLPPGTWMPVTPEDFEEQFGKVAA